MVKTEASHAFNIGSNPVRVTNFFLDIWKDVGIIQMLFADTADRYLVGVDWLEGPPVPIPNTEVKLKFAEDSCRVTDCENR